MCIRTQCGDAKTWFLSGCIDYWNIHQLNKYMLQLILIVPCIGAKVNVSELKRQITAYVGKRLIEDASKEAPCVFIKEPLSKEDKDYISDNIVNSNDCGLLFINIDRDDDNNKYLTAVVTTNEDEKTF